MSEAKEDFDALLKRDAFLSAIKSDNPQRVEELLKDGADPNALDEQGLPVLFRALPSPAIVGLLLDHGANADAIFNDFYDGRLNRSFPVLVSAIVMEYAQSARLLIEHGADVNVIDDCPAIGQKSTALMQAANHMQKDIVELLLDKGAAIDARDNRGQTALMWVAGNNLIPMIQLLIEKGAAPDLADNAGFTAEDHARQDGHTEAADIIKQAVEDRRKLIEEKARAQAAAEAALLAQKEGERHETVRERQKELQKSASRMKLRQP